MQRSGVGISWQFTFEASVSEFELHLSRISTPRTGIHRAKAWAELPASVAFICRRVISTQSDNVCGNVLAVYLRRSDAERMVSTHKKALRLATFLDSIHAAISQSSSPASLQSALRYLRRKGTVAQSNGTSFWASAMPHRHWAFSPSHDSRVIEKPGTGNDDHEEYGNTPIRNSGLAPE